MLCTLHAHLEVAAFLLDQELLVELLNEVNLALLLELVREILQSVRVIGSAYVTGLRND